MNLADEAPERETSSAEVEAAVTDTELHSAPLPATANRSCPRAM